MTPSTALEFRGHGGPDELGIPARWHRSEKEWVDDPHDADHPAGYLADPGLVDAVNTALVLGKPLLLTGRPGTGKSELAERVAWELGLGAVLRFEAQSLTEAQDLFYRFDLVGQMADAQLAGRPGLGAPRAARPEREFISFGPLGKAILRATPGENTDLLAVDRAAQGEAPPNATMLDFKAPVASEELPQAHRSLVLIDEIDKAARDVPNDLLNGIQRLEFRIRELQHRLVSAPKDPSLRPVVLITSNAERDLPEPFLRRCVYFHIPDPDENKLREILRLRVFPDRPPGPLPTFYEGLLDFYVEHRDHGGRLAYQPGTSELLDWTRALKRQGALETTDLAGNAGLLQRTLSAVAKHREDVAAVTDRLRQLGALPSQGAA